MPTGGEYGLGRDNLLVTQTAPWLKCHGLIGSAVELRMEGNVKTYRNDTTQLHSTGWKE